MTDPYFQDDTVTLYHGKWQELIDPNLVGDIIIADPPYGETQLNWDTWPKGWPALAATHALLSDPVTFFDLGLVVIDEDDQGVGFDLLFFNATATLGTINVAPSISDADARKLIGRVAVSASDYIDLGGVRVAALSSINQVLKAASGQTSVWIATITRSGAPTYTASGLKLKIGVL